MAINLVVWPGGHYPLNSKEVKSRRANRRSQTIKLTASRRATLLFVTQPANPQGGAAHAPCNSPYFR
jgi:hypothetical protein